MSEIKYIKVYFAAPYTNPDPAVNVPLYFETVALYCEFFKRQSHTARIVPIMPHAFHYLDARCPASYDEWMGIDKELIKSANMLVRLPGESAGAEIEVNYARMNDIGTVDFHNNPHRPWGENMAEMCKRLVRVLEVFDGK